MGGQLSELWISYKQYTSRDRARQSGSEAFEWLFLRYAPTLLLWISIILAPTGTIFLIISKRKNNTNTMGLFVMVSPFLMPTEAHGYNI